MLTEHGVPIAPRTFHAWVGRAPSKRALWDAAITAVLAGYYEPDEHGRRKPESLYGSLKMWAHLQREGIPVAKSTVDLATGMPSRCRCAHIFNDPYNDSGLRRRCSSGS